MARPVVTWVDRGQSERGPACDSTAQLPLAEPDPVPICGPWSTSSWTEGLQAVHRRPRPVCLTSAASAAEAP